MHYLIIFNYFNEVNNFVFDYTEQIIMPRKTKKENLFHHPHHRLLSWLVSEYGSYCVCVQCS